MIRSRCHFAFGLALLVLGSFGSTTGPLEAQNELPFSAPDRAEGEGPWKRLILRGATVIDGSGAPPYGPADIVIENDRIVEVRNVGYPMAEIRPEDRPKLEGGHEIDVSGMYILPGFVDQHGHQHVEDSGQGVSANYVHKLWMAHGITTIADVGNHDVDWLMTHRDRSDRNEITAPRMLPYVVFGSGAKDPLTTPERAREWVRWIKQKGAHGIKFFGAPPEIARAMFDEAKKQGLRTTAHHAQLNVTGMNVLDTARAGLTSMQHWYGLPEALFENQRIQDYPVDYNYLNEAHRFGEAGRLWKQAAKPGSERWNAVMDELLELDFTIVPTWIAYLASRDLSRQQRNEWHSVYTLPSLWDFYRPSRRAHGSYWFYWTSQDEVDWQENYRLWMRFVNEYKNRGGRVGLGSDSGYIYNLYGFGYIQEMELFLEAGFHPLEIFWSATLRGAQALGVESEVGSIQVGKKADLVVVPENPLENLKVLYGTGALKLNDENGKVERVGGVRYTVKDGIVYDAQKLLADVRAIVDEAKRERGLPPSPMPMFIDTEYPLIPPASVPPSAEAATGNP